MARILQFGAQVMGKKIKLATIDRELRAEIPAAARREPAGLYLLELRRRAAHNTLPRRRLMVIASDPEPENRRPRPVKITHL